MKLTLAQKILSGITACTVILVVVGIFSYRNSKKVVDSNEWVTHTHEVLTELNMLRAASVDGETSVRGFVITGNETFLDIYIKAKQNIEAHLLKLENLVADNPLEQQNINQLQQQLQLRLEVWLAVSYKFTLQKLLYLKMQQVN